MSGTCYLVRQHYKSEHWAPWHNQTPLWYDWKIVESDIKPDWSTQWQDNVTGCGIIQVSGARFFRVRQLYNVSATRHRHDMTESAVKAEQTNNTSINNGKKQGNQISLSTRGDHSSKVDLTNMLTLYQGRHKREVKNTFQIYTRQKFQLHRLLICLWCGSFILH